MTYNPKISYFSLWSYGPPGSQSSLAFVRSAALGILIWGGASQQDSAPFLYHKKTPHVSWIQKWLSRIVSSLEESVREGFGDILKYEPSISLKSSHNGKRI